VITNVNYGTRTISVSTPFTWREGDAVGYAYRGNGPDCGAYEYGDTLLTSATLVSSAGEYLVTPDGDTRFVVFYQDGIPHTIDFTAPFTATIFGGTVTANAFALHAQATPFVPAIPIRLSMRTAGFSRVEFSWTTHAFDYVLECADSLDAETWVLVTNVPVVESDQYKVTMETSVQQRWFRLRRNGERPAPRGPQFCSQINRQMLQSRFPGVPDIFECQRGRHVFSSTSRRNGSYALCRVFRARKKVKHSL
jgi:hypothetical protein